MFRLLDAHFTGVTPAVFDRDLAEKNWAILLTDDARRIVGFSTLLATPAEHEGERLLVIYSGDTIVARDAWGTPALARGWIASVNRIRADFRDRRCYWLLITSGFRTYRFLPVFWREFYPRCDAPTPAHLQRLMHHLAQSRYGSAYDAATGIVRLPTPQPLRPGLAGVPVERLQDPHVAFFLERNPGHAAGDELVSLCEIADHNLTRAGQRMVRG